MTLVPIMLPATPTPVIQHIPLFSHPPITTHSHPPPPPPSLLPLPLPSLCPLPTPTLLPPPPLSAVLRAQAMNCTNAEHPDTYGHYREAKITAVKHHWWWKVRCHYTYSDTDNPIQYLGCGSAGSIGGLVIKTLYLTM